ncbi:Ig-like domain-containing protein [Gordoniibacillus kamchatkensis]|nr:Ig-like domain-containing protein [Paenibacillus sp. VKM B-2647]
MIKPYSWYYQTPTDPANKVKTTARLHPTNQLSYNYNILRSQADTNGWVLETADASEYADFASFKNAVLAKTAVDSTHIDETNPRLIYKSLSGDVLDITFDDAAAAYNNAHKINNAAVNYSAFKLFDTPWLQQDQNSDTFTATLGGETLTYNFANWTITQGAGLKEVTLSADKTALKPGETASLRLSGTLNDGTPADLSKASVTFSTSNSAAVAVDGQGAITAVQEGTAQVKAAVTLGGTTVEAAPVAVTVDGTPPVTAAVTNPALPDGQNGWFVHPVALSLNAADNLSGVAKTEYSLDGGAAWVPVHVSVNVRPRRQDHGQLSFDG